MNVLLRRRRLVVGLPLVASILTAGISLLIAPTFTATTAFVPETSSGGRVTGGLAGLAGQLGISIGADASYSAAFYADVATTREILDQVLLSRYADPRSANAQADSATLLDILDVEGDDHTERLYRARLRLMGSVTAQVNSQTNVVTLGVVSRYPALAADVANRFVLYLNEFNAKTRQSQARARRRFAEDQVLAAETDLRHAEEAQKTFYERNRSWQQAPQLVFEEGQLRRQIEIRQEVYLTLRREYETAKVAEVNDTPVITVIYAAAPPHQRSQPKRKLLVVFVFVLSAAVSLFIAFGAEYVQRMRNAEDREYRELRGLLAQIRDDLLRVARLGKRSREASPQGTIS